jgi:hypothetical protein
MRKSILAAMAAIFILVGFAAPSEAVTQRWVYVVSQLPYPKYRVDYSVLDWTKSPYVAMRMASSCTGHKYCVTIKQAELGTSLAGVTSNVKYPDGSIRYTIKIDYAMAKQTYYGRKWVVCHELGHTLGVGHTTRNCMRDGAGVTGYPSWVAVPGSYNLSKAR